MKIITGDLFEIVTDGVIIQQVNCQNVMGAGFAKAFAAKYPKIKTAYHKFCYANQPEKRVNHLQIVGLSPSIIGINSFTQEYYGNSYVTHKCYTDEQELIKNLAIAAAYAKSKNKQLYAPAFIGCGLAGGNWEKLKAAIKDLDIVFIQLP